MSDPALSAHAPEGRFGPAAQEGTAEVLRDFSQEVDPCHARAGPCCHRAVPSTRSGSVHRRLPSMTLPESRRRLRGYEWLMVIPRAIAQQLGGADGIAAAGYFQRVETLRDGAVLLQVTAEFQDFTGEAIERTWRLLRPALRPGLPKRFDSDAGRPPSRIWYADIA